MSIDSGPDLVAQLVAEGLEHYGQDRIERAVACWRRALRMDPANAEVRDYLRSAGFEDQEPAQGSVRETGSKAALLEEARLLHQQGRSRDALELLQSVDHAGDPLVQAFVELIRSHIFVALLARAGRGELVPRLRLRPEEILKFNLPADAGFLLSMMDGATSVNEIVTLSGMDPFSALFTLDRLLEAGIVEVPA